jgi:3'-phosphoadenosine 5'-phosphosulfate sulfotransferase (PAPS reductase)/FAD synthetase
VKELKHIVLFSGGAASSYVAWLVAQEQDKKDIILLHTPTFSEHKDADRFRCQVARYIGLPITTWGDGRDIWELIDDNNCLPSQFIPFCTRILKQEMAEEYYKTLDEEYILYLGYGTDEWRRIQKQTARFEQIGRKARYPLFEKKITNMEVKRIIEEEWKIKLPEPYKYLKHNNCIPCFKAGKATWKLYWEHYPELFWKAVEKEKQLGYTVFKDKSLTELADIWQHNREFDCRQISMFDDGIPCTCAF